MLAIDDSASIFCARLIRGTQSIASTVTLRAASLSTSSAFSAGNKNEISVAPSRSCATSSSFGGRTLRTMSACHASARSTMVAPASV